MPVLAIFLLFCALWHQASDILSVKGGELSLDTSQKTTAPFCANQGPVSFLQSAEIKPRPASLVFCKQHQRCTCCNATSSLAVQRSVQSWIADPDLSPTCRSSMLTLTCRVCDPLIGTGMAHGLCPGFCEKLHEACQEDFFHYPALGDFSPCAVDRQPSVVCAQMREFAANGTQLCALLGLLASSREDCFDGSSSILPSCSQQPKSARRKRKRAPAMQGMNTVYLLLKIVGGLCLLGALLWSQWRKRQSRPKPLLRGLPYGQRAHLRPHMRAA